jgi:hypothetical protein
VWWKRGSRCDAKLGACGGSMNDRRRREQRQCWRTCGGGASKLVATRDTRGNYFFFFWLTVTPSPPTVVVTRWHAFKVAARNNFGLRQPKWTNDATSERSYHCLCRNVICAFLNNKEKTWDSMQNEAGDSFFLERALFLAENVISRASMHQNVFCLARKLDLDEKKLFIISMHTLFSTMLLP